MWPQFGDEILEDTLSISEGARQSLNRKRESMSDYHRETMQHHGLAPRDEPRSTPNDGGPPPPRLPPDHQGIPVAVNDDEDVSMVVSPSQPPPPPQGPASRFGQAPLRRPNPSDPPPDPRNPPGNPPGPRGPPGPYARTGLVDMNPDVSMGPSNYNIGGDDDLTAQGSLGKPPDFPGSGAAAFRARESFRTPQHGPGNLNMNPIVQVAGGGPPPPPPGAGAIMIPSYAAGPDPLEMAYQGPPGNGPGYDAALLEPRSRPSPYAVPRLRVTGKSQPSSLRDEFFTAPPEEMDTAASAPGAIVPMEEQNTVPKRPMEDDKPKKAPKAKAKKKKKEDEIAATQSPPSLPPPPPGGASALKITPKEIAEEGEPDVEPTSSSSSQAISSEPHYKKKEGYRKKPVPEEIIDDLPAVPVKRKTDKPLDDGTPAALRPDRQRPRAPAAEPDAEPNPLRVSASSSSSGPMVASQRRLM